MDVRRQICVIGAMLVASAAAIYAADDAAVLVVSPKWRVGDKITFETVKSRQDRTGGRVTQWTEARWMCS